MRILCLGGARSCQMWATKFYIAINHPHHERTLMTASCESPDCAIMDSYFKRITEEEADVYLIMDS